MSEADSRVPIFYGDFRYGIDDSRRVMIPAKWRPADGNVVFTAVLWPINVEEFLLVLPPERWQMLLDALKTKSLNDKRVATLERVIGATSAPLLLDKVGRFCLPDHLAVQAGIGKEAQFVGRLQKFEIWSPKRYRTATPEDKSVAAAMAEEINI
jgi:division/cell wall cluster transcriptional repressor MraZ